MTKVNVTILLPDRKFKKVRYVLLDNLDLNGVTVPAGFVTDGATIPRIFWPILPPVHKYFPAAILHDYLLTVLTRDEADAKFNEALKRLGISAANRYTMYSAVRLYTLWKKVVKLFKRKNTQ